MIQEPSTRQEAWRYADPTALRAYVAPVEPKVQQITGETLFVETLTAASSMALAFDVAEGAHLTHVRLVPGELTAPAFAQVTVNVAAAATYTNIFASFAKTYVRNEVEVNLDAAGAHTDLRGIYLLNGRGHCDTFTRVCHRAADTTSDEVYKGVLAERARGVFQAQIHVAPDAQRIVGNQMHRTLMLSDDARADAKPELEIFADDVQCSHGATVGDLDADQLYYLTSRGVPIHQARALLIEAFLADIVTALPGAHRDACQAQTRLFLEHL